MKEYIKYGVGVAIGVYVGSCIVYIINSAVDSISQNEDKGSE